MARPARRRPTLPPHDPRAIRGALRREIYELGDSLRFLDDIEFVPGYSLATRRTLRPIVNGRDIVRDMGHVPYDAFADTWVTRGLTDAEGTRKGVRYTLGPPPDLDPRHAQLAISVIGRYVLWQMGPEVGHEQFVFDRASYRESLREATLSVRPQEDVEARARREFFERTPWEGPERMGLQAPRLCGVQCPTNVVFVDPLWKVAVGVVIGKEWEPLEEKLARATGLIARWDTSELQACGRGYARPPYFPEHWGFLIERPDQAE